ncbi:hypothetical protein ABR737_00165 [Streptomyces sp. Edi2]|uniref:hypothetical protein n=1 Tax=Streptomyces sp. Edi2 TaxID=3162528 RepID=UPI003305AD66
MATYTLTMRIEANDDITPDRIRDELYEAAEDVPFSFDITDISERHATDKPPAA